MSLNNPHECIIDIYGRTVCLKNKRTNLHDIWKFIVTICVPATGWEDWHVQDLSCLRDAVNVTVFVTVNPIVIDADPELKQVHDNVASGFPPVTEQESFCWLFSITLIVEPLLKVRILGGPSGETEIHFT